MIENYAQEIINLSTGLDSFKVAEISHFDTSDVIVSKPYGFKIDESGKLIEMQLYFRVQNESKKMFGLTLYEMPLEMGEKYQNPIRIPGMNYFERTIHSLPKVLKILSDCGYEW